MASSCTQNRLDVSKLLEVFLLGRVKRCIFSLTLG